MTTASDIQDAIAALPPSELRALAAWFDEWREQRFDARIAEMVEGGHFEALAAKAREQYRAGRTTPLV